MCDSVDSKRRATNAEVFRTWIRSGKWWARRDVRWIDGRQHLSSGQICLRTTKVIRFEGLQTRKMTHQIFFSSGNGINARNPWSQRRQARKCAELRRTASISAQHRWSLLSVVRTRLWLERSGRKRSEMLLLQCLISWWCVGGGHAISYAQYQVLQGLESCRLSMISTTPDNYCHISFHRVCATTKKAGPSLITWVGCQLISLVSWVIWWSYQSGTTAVPPITDQPSTLCYATFITTCGGNNTR